LAVIDVLYKKGPILHLMGNGIILATILSMLLITAAATSIFLAHGVFSLNVFGIVGIFSIILFVLYLIAQYILYSYSTRQQRTSSEAGVVVPVYSSTSLKRTVTYIILSALAIVGAGIWLGFIGDQIAETTGFKASFVGTLFLAISTTAPEMVVSISAARLGALEMAAANVIGSNLFNIGFIIFLNDLVFSEGPILKYVSRGHILTALFALMMSSIVIIGIVFRPKTWMKSWVGIDTTFIAFLYIAALVTLYFYGNY
jgi:cation:H+ antiporter